MYLPEAATGNVIVNSMAVNRAVESVEGYEWVDAVLFALENFAGHVWAGLRAGSYSIFCFLSNVARDPSAWAMRGLLGVYGFLHEHPHIVSLLSLSIFFGPIIVLIPFVLLQEIGVLIAFYLGFFTHGLFPRGRIEDRYEALKEGCMESKEKVFASVEAVTATFNEWTTEYPVLMIFRVVCGLLGLYVLYERYGGWMIHIVWS
ncbi:hypothetical protein CC2G_013118 [Coprinopsis cinerea AmutBmut pab1-1]|nr:hypothetical protein CC2G_013118 [Coprinopsis cinerea AmutBmut pab1-1]